MRERDEQCEATAATSPLCRFTSLSCPPQGLPASLLMPDGPEIGAPSGLAGSPFPAEVDATGPAPAPAAKDRPDAIGLVLSGLMLDWDCTSSRREIGTSTLSGGETRLVGA